MLTVQQIVVRRPLPRCIQGGVYHPDGEESRTWCYRCEFLSTDIELAGPVKAIKAPELLECLVVHQLTRL